MRSHTLALGRDERGGLFPWRLNHDPRGVAWLVSLALGHEFDAVVVEPSPRGVAVAEGIERCPRHRIPLVRVARGRFQDEIATVWQRCVERHWLGAGRHGPRSGGHFLSLRVPGVKAVAFGAADARPLNLRQGDRHRHSGHDLTVRRDGHDLRVQSRLLLKKVRRAAKADVPGRRVHQQAGAVGDVLPRDVLDVSLEGVHVRHACVSLWRQREGKLARLRECSLVAADFSRDGGVATLAPADEFPAVDRKLVDDGGWRRTDGRSRKRPLHRARAHRRAKEIPRGDDSPQRLAGHRAIALERDIDAEVWTTVRGNQKRTIDSLLVWNVVVELGARHVPRLDILRRLRLRLVDLEHRAHRVVAERALGRQRRRPFGTAPVVDGDGTFVDDSGTGYRAAR